MKLLTNLLIKIKNLLPYLLLIAIYFFFVNLEAKKERNNYKTIKEDNTDNANAEKSMNKQIRITIPVIPYYDWSLPNIYICISCLG